MRTKAMAVRILDQIRHDKRTVALILIAPILILSLLYFILNSNDNTVYKIGVTDCSNTFVNALETNEDYNIKTVDLKKTAMSKAVRDQKVIAAVRVDGNKIRVKIDGTDSGAAKKMQSAIMNAALKDVRHKASSRTEKIRESLSKLPISSGMNVSSINVPKEPKLDAEYIYGKKDGTIFDNYGAPLMGIIIFFLVFLIAGINFLGERTSGTLEKLLTTPIRRHEIIMGYTLGFSVLAILQSVVITLFTVYVLGMSVEGNIAYMLLINLLTAVSALTLGMLLSTAANSEFQMMQFIPLVIIPQILFCGLFPLSQGWQVVGYFMPLRYTADALTKVMIRGCGFSDIWLDILVLLALCAVFMAGNSRLLKKMRAV